MCASCQFGIILEAGEDVAPTGAEAIVVVDRHLAICALSAGAEQLLGTSESAALLSPVAVYFVLAAGERGDFATRVGVAVAAALDHGATSSVAVRPAVGGPAGDEAMQMRVTACSSPPAALLVLATAAA